MSEGPMATATELSASPAALGNRREAALSKP